MSNKEFQVRHGLLVNNTVLVANTITTNVGIGRSDPGYRLDVVGTVNASNILINGSSITFDLSPANNYAGYIANSVNSYAISLAAASNTWANSVGTAGNNYTDTQVTDYTGYANSWANTVGASGNNYALATYYPKSGGTISGDVAITGNLTISGNTTYANTQTLLIGDNILTLNAELPDNVSPTENAGLEVNRGSRNSNAALLWIEIANAWAFTSNTLAPINTYIASNTLVETHSTAGNNYTDTQVANYAGYSNTWANTVGTAGNNYTNYIGSSGNLYADYVGVSANSYASSLTPDLTPAFNTANASYDKANSANLLAYNVGIGANDYASSVGSSSNNYTNSVGTAGNNYTNYVGASSNAYAASLTPDLSPSFNQANSAYDKANSANLLAYNISIGANAWSNTVGTAGNNYTDITVASFAGYANTWANSVGIAGNNYTNTQVTNYAGYANSWANIVGASANSYAASLAPDLSSAFSQANLAYDKANSANVLAYDTGIGANNWSNTLATAGNNYTNTVGTAGNNYTNTVGTAGNNYADYVGSSANAWANSADVSGNNYAGYMANSSNNWANTKLSNGTVTLAGALTTTGSITANGYIYINPEGGDEGGEIQLGSTGNNTNWSIDSYQNNFRVFARSGTTVSNLNFFHATGGSINLGINKTDPNYAVDVIGDVNVSGKFRINGVELSSGTFDLTPANNYSGYMANSVNAYTSATYSTLTQFNSAFDVTNTAFTIANSAYDKANSANLLAYNISIGANNWANTVGTAANNYTNIQVANYAGYANSWANTVGTASNNYTDTTVASFAGYSNTWANTVGTAGNNYTDHVGTAGNNYTDTVGTAGNNYTNTVGTAGNNYTDYVGTAGNNYTNTVGTAGNNYTNTVGTAGNNYTDYVGSSSNAWANSADVSGNTYAGYMANSANNWANTKLANTTGVTFEGNLHIKTNLSVGNNITNVVSLIFNTSTNITPSTPGELTWSQDDSTLHFDMNSPSNVIGHIGQDLFYYAKNQTGSTIPKGTVVRFAGTLGSSGRLLIAPAIANNSYPSKYIIGVTAASINDGDDGFVLSQGKIRGIDTSMFSQGDILYLSSSTPGAFSNTMPSAPNNKITVAAVVKKDNIQGTIELRVTLGSKLNEDELAELNNLTNDDILQYVSANGRFENINQNQIGPAINATAAFAKANAANVLAFNVAIGSNSWANTVGTAGNNYTDHVGVSANSNAATAYASALGYSNGTFVKLTSATTQTITGDLAITGNLTFSGNTTFLDSNTMIIGDSLLYLANNNYSGTDLLDIGIIANYANATGANVHTGIYRDHVSKQWFLFQEYNEEPKSNNIITPYSNNMVNAVLNADLITSNLVLGGTNAINWITSSFNKANDANLLAHNVSIGANTWANTVGTAGNNYTDITVASFAGYANTWANTVGTAGNNYTDTQVANYAGYSNTWANTVGTAGNNYTNLVGTAGNNYASILVANTGIGSNNWANTLATAGNNYTNSTVNTRIGWSNTWANTVGTAGNNYTNTVGTAGNNYTNTVGTAGNNYTNYVGTSANNYAGYLVNLSSAVIVSNTTPSTPSANTLWWNSDYGRLLIYYNDGDSSQWVDTNPATDYRVIFDTANTAFAKANAANTLAFNTGIGANAWANTVATAGNNYINTSLDTKASTGKAIAMAIVFGG